MSHKSDSFTKIKPSSERKGSTHSPDAYHRLSALHCCCLCQIQMKSRDFWPCCYNNPKHIRWYSVVLENDRDGVESSGKSHE